MSLPASRNLGAGKIRTHTNDGGDEEQHQHGDVEHDDPQQQQQHLGGGEGQSCSGTGMMLSVCVCLSVRPSGGSRNAPLRPARLGGCCWGSAQRPRSVPRAPPTERGPSPLPAPRYPRGSPEPFPRACSPSATEGAPPSPLPGDLQRGAALPASLPERFRSPLPRDCAPRPRREGSIPAHRTRGAAPALLRRERGAGVPCPPSHGTSVGDCVSPHPRGNFPGLICPGDPREEGRGRGAGGVNPCPFQPTGLPRPLFSGGALSPSPLGSPGRGSPGPSPELGELSPAHLPRR